MSLDNKQVRHLKVSSVSLWQVHCSVFHFKMSPFVQTGLKRCFMSVIFTSPHSWHYTLAVVLGYSSASFGAGSVVSSSQTPVCVTVSVSDRSCASIDWLDAGIRTPVGGGLALLKESMLVRRGRRWFCEKGTQGEAREKVFFLIGGFGILWG